MGRFLLAIAAAAACGAAAAPLCVGDDGTAVDMWLALKEAYGTEYAYWVPGAALAVSSHSMNSTTTGALARTLSQLWTQSSTEYIIWNDEPVGNSDYNYTVGHSKGLWAWDPSTGDAIIVQHSIPIFPAGPSQSSRYAGLGSNAYDNGQHVACFHTTVSALTALATLAQLTIPDIYDTRITDNTPSALANLAGGAYSTAASCSSSSFATQGGANITYFAKSTQWNSELYADCIAPAYKQALAAETWLHGASPCGASCTGYKVYDVKDVSYAGGALSFSNYDDHSKWAVATSSSSPLFCPSDINRMESQFVRGGAAYCFNDAGLATQMRAAITDKDTC